MTQRVLVIAAHPDDEVLGCGGTLCCHTARGDDVAVMLLTNGEGARAGASDENIAQRARAAESACEVIGATLLSSQDFPDNGMDQVALIDIIRSIEADALRHAPDIVYTHCAYDLNRDHRIAREVALTIFRPQPSAPRPSIYAFQVPSSTGWQGAGAAQFTPAHFVDISAVVDQKRQALACYDAEMRATPHVRSYEGIETRDRATGMLIGVPSAEAFVVERQFMR